ncbi:MAG: homoserine kinase [Gemmatimonadota bacterium]
MKRQPKRTATAFAPATVGNAGVGFDLLGHAVVSVGDRVTVTRTEERTVVVRSESMSVPHDPASNTASAGLLRLIEDLDLPFGFAVVLEKGIPLGSGMGGSASSAAGAILAANRLLPEPLDETGLLRYGMYGEEVATGSFHPDNLAPCLLGGLILSLDRDPLEVVRIPVPDSLYCVVVHPRLRLDTRDARRVLPSQICLSDHVAQSGKLAGVIAGCFRGDIALIGKSLEDLIVEPKRAPLVKGFDAVKSAALRMGALGCSLSGSGPSLFAWCEGPLRGDKIREAMIAAFAEAGVESRGWVSPVGAPGAQIEHEE